MAQLDNDIATLQQDVATQGTVIASATTLLAGISAQIQTAVDAAIAAGATPAQLSSLTDLDTLLQAQTGALSAAVVANTPAGPVGTSTVPGATGTTTLTGAGGTTTVSGAPPVSP